MFSSLSSVQSWNPAHWWLSRSKGWLASQTQVLFWSVTRGWHLGDASCPCSAQGGGMEGRVWVCVHVSASVEALLRSSYSRWDLHGHNHPCSSMRFSPVALLQLRNPERLKKRHSRCSQDVLPATVTGVSHLLGAPKGLLLNAARAWSRERCQAAAWHSWHWAVLLQERGWWWGTGIVAQAICRGWVKKYSLALPSGACRAEKGPLEKLWGAHSPGVLSLQNGDS